MRIIFVHHSCFVVELEKHILVFDYIPQDALPQSMELHGKMPELNPEKKVFFFVSHSHKDHFHPVIFSYLKVLSDVTYILGEDVKITRQVKKEYGLDRETMKSIHVMRPKSDKTFDDVKVETLRSNEVDLAGVAYVVTVEGLRIFHAGDLSWWAWKDSGEFMGSLSGQKYRKELHKLENSHVDLAFIPVDGRLGEGKFKGIKYYLRHVPTDLVFPMHMWGEYKLVEELKQNPEIADLKDKIMDIDRENLIFDIQD